jgi:linoleoyl-CoA desaturase
MKAIPFNNESENDREFSRVLGERVDAYFRKHRKRRFANGAMWAKAAFYFSAYWACWAIIVFGKVGVGAGLLLAIGMGFIGTCNALNISHDASHFTFAKEKWKSSVLFWLSMNQLGLYAHFWDLGHNKSHHYRTNISFEDVAVDGSGILRFHEQTPWKPFHRFQYLYAVPLYSTYTLLWSILRDWRVLKEGILSDAVPIRLSRVRILELVFVKVAYFTYILAIPMIYSPFTWKQVLLGFLAMHVVLSLYVAFTLFSSHLCDEVKFFDVTDTGGLDHSFVRHQFLTTCDFYPESRIASFFLGGFNSHVIHHLFPKVSSIHYPALAPILEKTAAEFKMPYLKSTLPGLSVSHIRFLKRLGKEPVSEARAKTNGNTTPGLVRSSPPKTEKRRRSARAK